MNKTFICKMEELGDDVELTYVKRTEDCEVLDYFKSKNDRILLEPRNYSLNKRERWLLRSSKSSELVLYVDFDGTIKTTEVDCYMAVRPAMWISIKE